MQTAPPGGAGASCDCSVYRPAPDSSVRASRADERRETMEYLQELMAIIEALTTLVRMIAELIVQLR